MFVHYFKIITYFLYVCQSVSWLTSLLKLDKCRDISGSGWDIFLKFFGDIPGMFLHYFHINVNCLYVCQPVSWLTFLQILGKYRDISCSWWDVFLKFLGDILGLFVHFFQIITDFLYVCQSIGWLTSIMKLGQYRDISYSGWDSILKNFGDIPGMFLHYFHRNANFLYVCQSVSWLTSLLKLDKYRAIYWSGWDIFFNFFWDISWIFIQYLPVLSLLTSIFYDDTIKINAW